MTERMNGSRRRGTICSLLVVALFFGGVTITRAQTTTAPCQTFDESCKGLVTKVAIFTGIGVGALIAWKVVSGKRDKAKRDAAPQYLEVAYEPTSGVALEHMVMAPMASNCPGNWGLDGVTIASGRLPSGLALLENHKIEGTPDGPGTWQASVRLIGLRCTGRDGRLQTYDDRNVPVTIRIQ